MALTEAEKARFKAKWLFPIQWASTTNIELFNLGMSLRKALDNYYYYKAEQLPISRAIRDFIKKYIWFSLSDEEKAVLDHPLIRDTSDATVKFFEAWAENIEGVKRGLRVEPQAQTDFLKFLFEKLEIVHNPEHHEIFENFLNTEFGMRLLRPNIQSHMYICFPFTLRPLKRLIRQYIIMAIISGNYELLLRRYPPFNYILKLNAVPGERTSIESRLDVPPIILRNDIKYTIALHLNQVQTRSNDRYITIPVVRDKKLELEHKAKVNKIKQEMDGIFPHMGVLGQIDIGEDGKVYSTAPPKKKPADLDEDDEVVGVRKWFRWIKKISKETEQRDEVPFYGMRRTRWLGLNAEYNLLRAIPSPGADSGLILKFNILSPLITLIEGINGVRPVSLAEVKTIMKVFDLYRPKAMQEALKPPPQRELLREAMDTALNQDRPQGLSPATQEFLDKIERLEAEASEEKAWEFVNNLILEGKIKEPIQAIHNALITDGFEVLFNLWPLITGMDIKIDKDTGDVEYVEREDLPKDKTLLPILDYLKREIEDLLKNVFTKYLDISAATARYRSEPILAEMIVEYCLNLKMDEDKFREKLTDHLTRHYRIHFEFLIEYIKKGRPRVLKNIYNIEELADDEDVEAQKRKIEEIIQRILEKDVPGIMQLIENTRYRLCSPTENDRLLRFIDPYSVDVQIGNFQYDGKAFRNEETFIKDQIDRQYELAQKQRAMDQEVEKNIIEKKGNRIKIEWEKKATLAKEELHKVKTDSEIRILEHDLHKFVNEAKVEAVKKLREGDVQNYAKLTLIKAHHEGGIDEVERILEKHPNILLVLDPESYERRHLLHMKEELIKIVEKDPTKVDPLTLSILFSEEFKNIVDADIFKNLSDKLMDAFTKLRFTTLPPQMLYPHLLKGPAASDEKGKKESDQSSEEESGKREESTGNGAPFGTRSLDMDPSDGPPPEGSSDNPSSEGSPAGDSTSDDSED